MRRVRTMRGPTRRIHPRSVRVVTQLPVSRWRAAAGARRRSARARAGAGAGAVEEEAEAEFRAVRRAGRAQRVERLQHLLLRDPELAGERRRELVAHLGVL